MNKETLDRINRLVPQLNTIKKFINGLNDITLSGTGGENAELQRYWIDFFDDKAKTDIKNALAGFKCRLERELKELGYEEDEE